MPNLITVPKDVHFSLFKGEPGTRKSTAALSYPKPQYWFPFDEKMNGLLIPAKKWGINPTDIDYDHYKDWNLAEKKLEAFQLNCKYKTIIIDSITSAGDKILRQTLNAKDGTKRKSGDVAGKKIAGIEVNELEDFNAESSAFNTMIALLKDIQQFHHIDIILIAHIIRTEQKDPKGFISISRQIVTAAKKNAAKIPAYCDEAYHFSVSVEVDATKGGKYEVITSNVGDDYARTSLELPTKIEMGDRPLYQDFILPAIVKQKEDFK